MIPVSEVKLLYRDAKNRPLFLDAEAEILFLKYAIPAMSPHRFARTHSFTQTQIEPFSKQAFTQTQIELFAKQASEGILPDINLEKTFDLAVRVCKAMAKLGNKTLIDSDVIREYFLIEHNPSVEYRHSLGEKNLDPVLCKTYIGKVTETGEGYARVETTRGNLKYNPVFTADVKIGDKVAVHYNYITEKITPNLEKSLQSIKANKRLLIKNGA